MKAVYCLRQQNHGVGDEMMRLVKRKKEKVESMDREFGFIQLEQEVD